MGMLVYFDFAERKPRRIFPGDRGDGREAGGRSSVRGWEAQQVQATKLVRSSHDTRHVCTTLPGGTLNVPERVNGQSRDELTLSFR